MVRAGLRYFLPSIWRVDPLRKHFPLVTLLARAIALVIKNTTGKVISRSVLCGVARTVSLKARLCTEILPDAVEAAACQAY